MAVGALIGKRRSTELSMPAMGDTTGMSAPVAPVARVAIKRARRPTCRTTGCVDVRAALGSGLGGFERLPARLATLADHGLSEASVTALYSGLGGDTDALLRLVDGNTYAAGVLGVLRDVSSSGKPLTDLNVRAHSWSVGPAASVVTEFARRAGADRAWAVGVVRWVVASAFAGEATVGITALEGGGVRDVLLREWWRTYGPRMGGVAGTRPPLPVLLIVTGGTSGRSFLVPSIEGGA